ncbi:MAG: hypothetical protein ABJH84_12930, partial [Marinobacter sp.]
MALIKTATVDTINPDGTFNVTFDLETTNTGNVTLSNLTLVDDLNAQYGAGVITAVVNQPTVTTPPTDATSINPGSPSPTFTGAGTALVGTGGVLAVGDSYTVSFTVTLDPTNLPAPINLENTATTGATLPVPVDGSVPGTISDNSENGAIVPDDGNPATAVVSDGTDPDTTDNDTEIPTVITFDVEGGVTLVKAATLDTTVVGGAELNVGDQITYTFTVTNTSSALNALNVAVSETLFTGTGTAPTPVPDDNGTDIDTTGTLNDLAPNARLTWSATYVLTQADIDAGMVDNQASVTAEDPFGNALTDVSDNDVAANGIDGADNSAAGDGTGNVTSLPFAPTPDLSVVKGATSVGALQADGSFDVTYTLVTTNTGNVTLDNLTLVD